MQHIAFQLRVGGVGQRWHPGIVDMSQQQGSKS